MASKKGKLPPWLEGSKADLMSDKKHGGKEKGKKDGKADFKLFTKKAGRGR